MTPTATALQVIGTTCSPLTHLSQAPLQPDEGAPPAQLHIDATYAAGLKGLCPGDEIVVVTWLHEADRDTLAVHPRGDRSRPATGVFATRSQDRPNPIGLHRVTITAMDGFAVSVDHLEVVDGTPILDIKPVLGELGDR